MSNVPTNLIPTTVTGLPEYTGSSTLGYLPYVVDGRTYKVQFSNIAAVGAVPSSRTIATGTGLTGGGDLSANRTIAIANGGVGTAQLAASGVSAGVYGSGTLVPVLTVDATGRVTSATTAAVSVSGFVPTSRSVIAGTGLTGGGALTSDVTLNVNFSSSTPQALGTATAGVSTAAARGDHVHPAVNLADTSQTQGALPLGRGGTGDALSPVAGAVVYSTGTRFALSPLGLPGQVLMSDGANAPQWATVSGIGTVTSVNVSGGTTGLTFSGGPVMAAGTITMAGTLAVGNGGTGLTSLTANFVPKGNGTAAFSASQIFDNGTNVGIGTATPGAKLHVSGGNVFVTTSGTYSEPAAIAGVLAFDSANGDLNISARSNGGNTLTRFWTSNAGAGAERMRITNTGLVGIGTTSPGYRLDVANSDGSALARFKDSDSAHNGIIIAGDTNGGWVGNNAQITGEGIYYQNSINAMRVYTNSLERMRINSAGDVGFGTTAPANKFVVSNGGANGFEIDPAAGIIQTFNRGTSAYTDMLVYGLVHRFFAGTSPTERMRITAAGNVGIGTTAPASALNVVASDGFGLEVSPSNAGYVNLQSYNRTTSAFVPFSIASSFIAFQTNGTTERMRVKANGQVRFVPLAAAPAGPEAGDVYYDSTTNKLRCYNGTTWNDLF